MTTQKAVSALTTPIRCEQLVATLEEDIVLGVIYPCQRLVEDELMERFDAKRHIVRDALAKLEQLGLVERRRNVGALVRSFDEQEVLDLYDMRILLECEAMRRMPLPVPPAELRELKQIQADHDVAVANDDQRRIFRTNQAFHERLYGLCGNQVIAQAIQEYARRTHAIRFGALSTPEQQHRSLHDHHEVLQALEKGQRDILIELAHSHLLPSRDRYMARARTRGA
jgi:DNA-binding GntR family transcriptional regulator